MTCIVRSCRGGRVASSSISVVLGVVIVTLLTVVLSARQQQAAASVHLFQQLAQLVAHGGLAKHEVLARARELFVPEGFTVPDVTTDDCTDVPNADFPLPDPPCGRDRCALWLANGADDTYASCLTHPTAGGGPVHCQGVRQHFRDCMGLTCFNQLETCLETAIEVFNTALFTTCVTAAPPNCVANAVRDGAFALRSCTAGPAVMTPLVPLFGLPTTLPLTQVLSASWAGVKNHASETAAYAVVNINNGPGLTADADYLWALDQMLLGGSKITLIGYVPTLDSGNLRSAAAVKTDISAWRSIYGTRFRGIFLDNHRGYTDFRLSYYKDLYKYCKRFGLTVIANVGSDVTGAHLRAPTADVFVVFSGTEAAFNTYAVPWARYIGIDPSRLAAWVTDLTGSTTDAVNRAQSLRLGGIFVTDQSSATSTTLPAAYATLISSVVTANSPSAC